MAMIDIFNAHPLIQLQGEEYREYFKEKFGIEPRWVPTGWNEESRLWVKNYITSKKRSQPLKG